MELKIDLLEKKKKNLWLIGFGILAFSFAIFFGIVEKKPLDWFIWVYFGFFVLHGVNYFIRGLGYSIERFLGKAYILINSEIISLKSSIYEKKQFVNWNEIKSINYNPISTEFKIEKTDGTTQVINISNFDYALLLEIKKTVSCIAKEKNIQVNI